MRKKFFLLIIVCLVMGAVTDIEGNFTILNVNCQKDAFDGFL